LREGVRQEVNDLLQRPEAVGRQRGQHLGRVVQAVQFPQERMPVKHPVRPVEGEVAEHEGREGREHEAPGRRRRSAGHRLRPAGKRIEGREAQHGTAPGHQEEDRRQQEGERGIGEPAGRIHRQFPDQGGLVLRDEQARDLPQPGAGGQGEAHGPQEGGRQGGPPEGRSHAFQDEFQ
jgi:hypothetical protein